MAYFAGTTASESLSGGAGNDIGLGLAGNDTIFGLGGEDVLFGGAGNDTVIGGSGADALFGGAGDDTLLADVTDRTLKGGTGADTILYSASADIITGDMWLDGARIHLGAGDDHFSVTLQGTVGAALNLASLDSSAGSRFDGGAAGDFSGYAISGVGDVNGDGFADFVIGAHKFNGDSGRAYLVFGSGNGLPDSVDLGVADPNVVVLNGVGQTGFAVSGAGDVNGDGWDDVLIAANNADDPGDTVLDGQVYILFGKASGWTDGGGATIPVDLTTLNGSNGFMLHNASNDADGVADQFGSAASSAGDINGDGRDELVISAPDADGFNGITYVVYGHTTGWSAQNAVDGAGSVAHLTLTGANVGAVAAAGDVNDDGYGDMLLGAWPNGTNFSGVAYLLFGGPTLAPTINLQQVAANHTGIEIRGLVDNDNLGFAVSSAGDFNGDGFADFMIGARNAGGTAGAAYVIFGKAGGWDDGTGNWRVDLTALDGSNGFAITGVLPGDRFGSAVSSAGDINGDGFGDLIVGAPGVAAGGANAGIGYILFGRAGDWDPNIDASSVDGRDSFRIEAPAGSGVGLRATGAGDVNADGLADVLISGVDANDGAGVTYLVYGSRQIGQGAAGTPLVIDGQDGNDTIDGFNAADTLYGGTGNDVLSGKGGDDTLQGAAGNDTLYGGAGNDLADYSNIGTAINATLNSAGSATIVVDGTDRLYEIEGLAGGSGNDTLIGDSAGNLLVGNGGDDTLSGGDGLDLLRGGQGTNILTGGDGADTVSYIDAPGGVTVDLTAGTATATGISDTLSSIENAIGSDFADTLVGTSDVNTLRGDDGNDLLVGGAGADALFGGSGSDTVSFADAGASVIVNLVAGTASSGGDVDQLESIEVVIGSAFDDTLVSGSGDDRFNGGAGGDLFVYRPTSGGSDTIEGFAAGDRIDVSELEYTSIEDIEADGGGMVQDGADVVLTLAFGVLPLEVRLIGVSLASMTEERFVFFAGFDESIGGSTGNDTLDGQIGNDTIYGGQGNDVLDGAGDADSLYGGTGSDTLYGGDLNDVLEGGLGNDLLYGGDGIDTASYADASGPVIVDLGSGTASGADGTDELAGIEIVIGSAFNDQIVSGSAADTLFGALGDDTLTGAGDGDALYGGEGSDLIYGGTDSDTLEGGDGDDTLVGGSGDDFLEGGAGSADVAVFSGSWSDYTILGSGGTLTLIGPDGTDVVSGVELFQFDDGVFSAADIGNDEPIAAADVNGSDTLREGGAGDATGDPSASGNVCANDTDADSPLGDTLTVTAISSVTAGGSGTVGAALTGKYGSLTVDADGTWTYALNNADPDTNALTQGQIVTDVFNYTVSDSHGATDSASLTITITGTNDAPTVVADTNGADAVVEAGVNPGNTAFAGDSAATGNVLTNDSDVEVGDGKTVTTTGTFVGTYGTLTLAANGTWSYALNNADTDTNALTQGQSVADVFNYTVQDGGGATASSTLSITITGTNDRPTATADLFTYSEDESGVSGSVRTNDSDVDAGTTLTVTSVNGTAVSGSTQISGPNGTLTISPNGGFTFQQSASHQSLKEGESADVVYTYTVSDGQATSDSTVTFRIQGANDAPVAVADINGADAVVEAGVNPGNTAFAGDASATGNVLTNDTDVDTGDTRTVTTTGTFTGTYGTLTLAANGTWSYALNNADTDTNALSQGQSVADVFSYTIQDVSGATASSTLSITVTGTNDAPVAVADTNGSDTVSEAGVNPGNTTFAGDASATGNVLTNDTDVDAGSTKTVTTTGTFTGTYGTLTLAANGTWSYSLNNADSDTNALTQGQSVADVFNYTMQDGSGATSSSTLSITVVGTNDAPVAVADSLNAPDPTAITYAKSALLGNDTDADAGTTLTIASVTSGTGGTVVLNGNGDVVFTPTSGFSGLANFTYTVSDGSATSAAIQVTVLVGANNDPVAADDSNAVAEEATVSKTAANGVLANDTDSDPDQTRTVTQVNGSGANVGVAVTGTLGTLTLNVDGSYSYVANRPGANALAQGATAVDSFTYQLSDGVGGFDTATLSITVTGTNDAPVISSASTFSVAERLSSIGSVVATDADTGAVLTYSISGGADAARFAINASSGALSFVSPRDFDNPTDVGGNNVYDVQVTVADANGGSAVQSIAVTVTNNNPSLLSSLGPVAENTVVVGDVDAAGGDTSGVTYSITPGLDGARFRIDSTTGVLSFNATPNFESPTDADHNNVYRVTVQAIDATGHSTSQTYNITVTNAVEGRPGDDVLEANGATTLSKMSNRYLFEDGPSLKYLGDAVTPGQFGGWAPIAAEAAAGGGYDVAWKMAGADQYIVWHTNGYGNTTSMSEVMSASSHALQSFETAFDQDLNGDGTVGLVTSTIEAAGGTSLIARANRYFLDNGGPAGPSLKQSGTAVTAGQFGAWAPIGAEAAAGGGYDVVWKMSGADQYIAWHTDSGGNVTSMSSVITGSSTELRVLETLLGQDLNGNSTVGVTLTDIETAGATSLKTGSSRYFIDTDGTPLLTLKYLGANVTAGQFGGWAPIGVEAAAGGGYDVVWKLSGADQYIVWHTDSYGNDISMSAVMTGSSSDLQALEILLGQDLNGVGGVGVSLTDIEAIGATGLSTGGGRYFLEIGGTPELTLKYLGANVTSGQFGAWAPIGVEAAAGGGYDVVWKMTGADQYIVWHTDSYGNDISMSAVMTGSSADLRVLETLLGQDLNGNGTVGVSPTDIETAGTVGLSTGASRYFFEIGGTPVLTLKYLGANVTTGQFGGWAPIGVEASAGGGYDVVWKNGSANEYIAWHTDSSGNTLSMGAVVSGGSHALQQLEDIFAQDFNGDGTTGFLQSTIETAGSIDLIARADRYVLGDGGPTLQYLGAAVTAGQFGAWAPIGVEAAGDGYEVVWKATGADQYISWHTDSNGNMLSMGDMVTGNTTALRVLETLLNQDLNANGSTGLATSAIESLGSTGLRTAGSRYFFEEGGATGPTLKYQGDDVVSGQFGAWAPIAAEAAAGDGFDVVWKATSANEYVIWHTDSYGEFVSSLSDVVSGSSYALQELEDIFEQDINGDGTTGFATTQIEADGLTDLLAKADRYFLEDGVTPGPSIKYAGADVAAGQFGGWTPIGAEAASGGYDIVWRMAGADQYIAWHTDSLGNVTSMGNVMSGNSQALRALETAFNQDLNGSGFVG